RLFGLSPDQMIGKPATHFLASPGLVGDFPRDAVATGEHRVFGVGEEAVGRRNDGTIFPASISMSKMHSQRGRLVTLIVHDLTGLKKTEEALRHSEARLRMVLNQVPAILCSTDHRLRITLLTCSVGTGLSGLNLNLPRFTGTSLRDPDAPTFLPASAFERALQGESVTAEIQWEDRILEFHIEPLRGEASAIVGAVGVGLDVTEHKRIEKAREFYAAQLRERNIELSRSNQELDEFAYIASHDLKEPLRGIHNYASFLIEDYGERLGNEGRAKLETLKHLTQRMDALIESLLQFSRVGRVDLAVQNTDLNEVVEEVLASLQISLEEGRVEVRFGRTLPHIRCDRVRIAEVFRNLFTNAMKYNDKPKRWVEIGMTATPSPVFYVRDNGIGIAAQHHEAIFRIFKRLHSRDKFGGGTGAGLTIVKKIVERHSGRIWVESTPGEGSTFYFTIGEKTPVVSGVLIH
ncbi:MAG TPA: ATP-binding protein, partial [Gemmataceae bacterium]|nr:ATP-binding protein [Gemmataceae bacterium]